MQKYVSGQLGDLQLGGEIAQITEGDVSITYADAAAVSDVFVDTMKEKSVLDHTLLQNWRRLSW